MKPRGLIAWFAHNTVASNILMLMICGAGLMAIPRLKVEVFPEFSPKLIQIAVPYPGAAPEEVEEGICRKIEEQLEGLPGLRKLTSSAAEGVGAVTVEVEPDESVQRILSEVRSRVDAIQSWPQDAERSVVQEVWPRAQVINVAISGDVPEEVLRGATERLRDGILGLPMITQVDLAAARPYEVSIEVSELNLRRYDLTLGEVAAAVRSSSIDLPGGVLKTDGGDVLLRSTSQAYQGAEFESLVLRSRPDGTRILLGDVATVKDGFKDMDLEASFDGQRSLLLQVYRVGDQSALQIADEVRAYCDRVRASGQLPHGVAITPWRDDARYLRGRLDTLLRNGWQGLLAVFIVLALFLRTRVAFWVSLGIPISFLGTVALMPVLGVSINLLSLFAFIVVLGIVVDDAIIVGESIYRRIAAGENRADAVVSGTREVAVPVVFAVLSSVAAFWPLASLPGTTGQIWRVIPLVVVPTLLWSLVECQLILPAHLAHLGPQKVRGGVIGAWRRFQGLFSRGLERSVDLFYQPTLKLALRWRYVTLAGAFALAILTGGLIASGTLAFRFFPKLPADDVACELTMPMGTPWSITEAAIRRIESAAIAIADEAGDGVVAHVMATVGSQPWRNTQSRNPLRRQAGTEAAHLGEVHVALVVSEERPDAWTSDRFVRLWREKVGPIAGTEELSYSAELMGAGKAVDIQLTHPDLSVLRKAADEVGVLLASYDGVLDVSDSFRGGKREIQLKVTPEGESLGVRQASLGRQVRQAFFGEEVQRMQRGRDEVKVWVRYPSEDRQSLADLEGLYVRLPSGVEVPLGRVAEVEEGRGFSTIQRTDRHRTVHVTSDIDMGQTTPGDVVAGLQGGALDKIVDKYPGLSWSLEGERREQADTLAGLVRSAFFALFAIYALMAVPFKSYLQPLVVMSAIPFGIVGAFWGHLIMGLDANVLSMFGMVALAGVVVNDNLVLVDTINRQRLAGTALMRAVTQAGATRFRPILLTSLTTFVGLSPLMMETSLQARFLIPMAVSLAFGVLFSTMVSLILVPSLYLILQDLGEAWAWLIGRGADPEAGPAGPPAV
jgi:multidrug efflux pump subunit AcrB